MKTTVIAACLRASADIGNPDIVIEYQVSWWSGRERRCEWIAESEIHGRPREEQTMTIGFK